MTGKELADYLTAKGLPGIYGYMYGEPWIHGDKWKRDKIILIKWDELEITMTGFRFVWGWPGPDVNWYGLKDFGITWAFRKADLRKMSLEEYRKWKKSKGEEGQCLRLLNRRNRDTDHLLE